MRLSEQETVTLMPGLSLTLKSLPSTPAKGIQRVFLLHWLTCEASLGLEKWPALERRSEMPVENVVAQSSILLEGVSTPMRE